MVATKEERVRVITNGGDVPTIEEIERLFSKLPQGKYLWFRYAGNQDKGAFWFAPTLMTGKAKVSEENEWGHITTVRLHKSHPLGFEFWVSDCGNFAVKMTDEIKEDKSDPVSEKLCDATMTIFKRIIDKGLIKFVRAH